MTSYRGYVTIKKLHVFICYLMVFINLKLFVFKNLNQFFNFAVFLFFFCLIVTEPYYGVVPYLFKRNTTYLV